VPNFLNATPQSVESISNVERKTLACFGEHHSAADPPEQRHPQRLFERLDLVAHGPVGDVKLFGCTAQIQVAGGRVECAKCVQRRQSIHHWPM